MIEDIRKLKAGALIQIHSDLHYKTSGQSKHAIRQKTKKDEVFLLLKLEKRRHESMGAYPHNLGAKVSKDSYHYYLHVLRNGQLVNIFFHSITETTNIPEDLENTKYASYVISEVTP
jgi:hypothetical protein